MYQTVLYYRIHTLGLSRHNTDHPDSRAIMFESETYSKRKIDSFLSVIDGFTTALRVVDLFKSVDITYVFTTGSGHVTIAAVM